MTMLWLTISLGKVFGEDLEWMRKEGLKKTCLFLFIVRKVCS